MPVNLSIKEVPDVLADRLRRRAARNHRSLQRELMAIVEAAVSDPTAPAAVAVHAAAPAAAAYWHVPAARDRRAPVAEFAGGSAGGNAGGDGLLAALDTVVAGSRWGHAPLLTREQAHDRRLLREIEFDARQSLPGSAAP